MKVISNIDKFIFQDFRQVFAEQKNERNQSFAFPESFHFPGKITSNTLQILILYLIKFALNMTPIYAALFLPDDK